MPCLSYLPTLTPEMESLQLLRAAYPALVALAHVRYPRDDEDRKDRTRFLGKVLRQGVLKGYVHAGEHVKIAEFLVLQIAVLVDEMGVSCVIHFKARVPTRNIWVASLTVWIRTCSPYCQVSYRRLSPRLILLYSEHRCIQCSNSFSMDGRASDIIEGKFCRVSSSAGAESKKTKPGPEISRKFKMQ